MIISTTNKSPVVYLNENNNIISNKNKTFKDGKKRLPSLYSQQKILAKINDIQPAKVERMDKVKVNKIHSRW